jgi:hypothetical protein
MMIKMTNLHYIVVLHRFRVECVRILGTLPTRQSAPILTNMLYVSLAIELYPVYKEGIRRAVSARTQYAKH